MNIRMTALAACLAAVAAAGCHDDGKSATTSHDGPSMSAGNGDRSGSKPLEGNPGATTGPSAGYPQSDPTGYHPQTDDTHQYHPASPDAVQPK